MSKEHGAGSLGYVSYHFYILYIILATYDYREVVGRATHGAVAEDDKAEQLEPFMNYAD